MIGEYGLEILNFGNTWYRSHKDGTVLKSAVDHALINKTASVKNYFKTAINYSDHDMICVDLNVSIQKPKKS